MHGVVCCDCGYVAFLLSVICVSAWYQVTNVISFVLVILPFHRSDPRTMKIELLVQMVDVVLEGSGIDEKFLGVTLFALVPNTTEFLNAISFALNGNIALRWAFTLSHACQLVAHCRI